MSTTMGIIFAGFLASCSGIQVREHRQSSSEASSGTSYCDFEDSQKAYDANDLLRCMNDQASLLLQQQTARASGGKDSYFPLPQMSDLFSLLSGFTGQQGGGFLSSLSPSFASEFPHQSSPTSSSANAQYGSSVSSGGFGIKLFDALGSISQFDDFKCVPRILCEVASGGSLGGLNYRQSSNYIQDFGKNALFGLLTNFDVGQASPLLNFGKAALLGYTNKGNSENCYRQYPRCPRNPSQLIHYLNNYNGGFFRFFNGRPNYNYHSPQNSYHHQGVNTGYYSGRAEKFPSQLLDNESERTGTGELKFDDEAPSARQNDENTFFPSDREESQSAKFVFPSEKKSASRSNSNLVFYSSRESGESKTAPNSNNFRFYPEATDVVYPSN